MTTVKRIAKLAQELSAADFNMLVELRKVLGSSPRKAAAPKAKRKYTRKFPKETKTAKAGNGAHAAEIAAVATPPAVKRGPGRPRKDGAAPKPRMVSTKTSTRRMVVPEAGPVEHVEA